MMNVMEMKFTSRIVERKFDQGNFLKGLKLGSYCLWI